jgi:hypothetical protein
VDPHESILVKDGPCKWLAAEVAQCRVPFIIYLGFEP